MVTKRLAVAWLGIALGLGSCGGGGDLPNGLLLAISRFEKGAGGAPKPHSELVFLSRRGGEWTAQTHEDPSAPVFHKALLYQPPGGELGILTLGGSAPGGPAALKLWHKTPEGFERETVWEANFGGKFSRMRDAELADLDGDGAPEIYATPSEPNRLDGTPQHGEVVRYAGGVRSEVADLGTRHAKEILVTDVDGDGRDELYVSVEAAEGGSVEVRRYEGDTDPKAGVGIASLYDPMARFLTAGDVDGDGKKEMVVAGKDSGLWLLRPGSDPKAAWRSEPIDAQSKGFEHAALLADLDGDGESELYVASDDDKEIRRYAWDGQRLAREVIHKRADPQPVLTWNLAPVPVSLVE